MPRTYTQEIYALAEPQDGFLTTRQARRIGISAQALVMMERRGHLERTHRGVYRLVNFPPQPLAAYREAVLCLTATNDDADPVLSHETALVLHQLSDVSPAKLHLTLPVSTRLRRTLPHSFVLHIDSIKASDRTLLEGLPVTTVERTLRDCHAAQIGPAILQDAIDGAVRYGHLTKQRAQVLMRELR